MKRIAMLMLFVLSFAGLTLAQDAPKPPANAGEVVDRQFKNLESEFVPLAEAMPADKYDFAPTAGEFKGVRTFALQARHVATVNYMIGSALLGEKPPVDTKSENGSDDLKTKDQIVKYLKDSFVYVHKAINTINDKNVVEMIDGPFGSKASRIGLGSSAVWHGFDHYGQMVVYLRMNGLVPPASR
jgi:DinB family protein